MPRQARTVGRLGVLFLFGLISACTCSYSAAVVNNTDSLLFANLSYEWQGQRREEEGILVPPHSRKELSRSSPSFLRVRDMSGDTVAFQHLTEREDTRLVVSTLERLPDPEPLGIPTGAGSEGLSSKSRAIICRDGHEEEVPFFRMTITIASNFNSPLVVSGIEPFSDRDSEAEMPGVLVPSHGEASLHLEVVEEAWIRALDPESRTVFTKAVPREPLPVVTIPSSLPAEPEPIPSLDFSRGTGLGTDCSPITIRNLTVAGVVAVVLLSGITVWAVWRRRRRRAAPS